MDFGLFITATLMGNEKSVLELTVALLRMGLSYMKHFLAYYMVGSTFTESTPHKVK